MSRESESKIIEVLVELSRNIGGEFVEGKSVSMESYREHGTVRACVGPWIITIGAYTNHASPGCENTGTEMHVPYVSLDGLQFSIMPPGWLARLLRKLRLVKDVEVGFRDFDEAFLVIGTDESKLRALFADEGLRRLTLAQPKFNMTAHHKLDGIALGGSPAGWPNDVNLLRCGSKLSDRGEILDAESLKAQLDIFVATLERLCQIGSALKEPPGVELYGRAGSSREGAIRITRTEPGFPEEGIGGVGGLLRRR